MRTDCPFRIGIFSITREWQMHDWDILCGFILYRWIIYILSPTYVAFRAKFILIPPPQSRNGPLSLVVSIETPFPRFTELFLFKDLHYSGDDWPTKGPEIDGANFWFGASFGAYGPKRAQNGPKSENWTRPTVFELGSSSPRGILTYPRPKNWCIGFLIWGPVLDLWP